MKRQEEQLKSKTVWSVGPCEGEGSRRGRRRDCRRGAGRLCASRLPRPIPLPDWSRCEILLLARRQAAADPAEWTGRLREGVLDFSLKPQRIHNYNRRWGKIWRISPLTTSKYYPQTRGINKYTTSFIIFRPRVMHRLENAKCQRLVHSLIPRLCWNPKFRRLENILVRVDRRVEV